MTRHPLIARRAEALLGRAVVATAPLAGGDGSAVTKLRLSDGSTAVLKTHPQPPPGYFEHEAAGLRWLGSAPHGAAVPEVLAEASDCLVLRWVEPAKATPESAEAFGRALAHTHAAGADTFGAAPAASPSGSAPTIAGFIGRVPLAGGTAATWPEFYAEHRVLPYLRLARDRGAADAEQASLIEAVLPRLGDWVPTEPPARLHGDLWNGNVLWGAEPGAQLIDPAAHGGHRETDLAMLALFGLPQLVRVFEAYHREAPLAEGWEERLALHQLFPLLVHAGQAGRRGGAGFAARAALAAGRFVDRPVK